MQLASLDTEWIEVGMTPLLCLWDPSHLRGDSAELHTLVQFVGRTQCIHSRETKTNKMPPNRVVDCSCVTLCHGHKPWGPDGVKRPTKAAMGQQMRVKGVFILEHEIFWK